MERLFSFRESAFLRLTIVVFALLTTFGCSDGEGVDELFGINEGGTPETETEIIEVPPEKNLSIEITLPDEDNTPVGYQKSIGGTCGTVGLIVSISGAVTTFGVCGVDKTWEATLDLSGQPVGTVSISAQLLDGDTAGTPAARLFDKTSAVCDTEAARNDTFANFTTPGTPPWQICTPGQLGNIGTTYQADDVEIMSELDFGGGGLSPIGNTSGGYSGTFNGNGFTIKNFAINTSGTNQTAIFRESTGATIQNVRFENVSVKGAQEVALLVGRVESGNTTFSDIVVDGLTVEILTTSNDGYSGGLIGRARAGGYDFTVSNISISNVTITGTKRYTSAGIGYIDNVTGSVSINGFHVIGGEVEARQDSGGVIGRIHENISPANTKVINVFNSTNVSCTSGTCGGVIGYATGTFINVANTGNIRRDGGSNFGGIAGYFRNGSVSGTSAAATRESVTPPEIPSSAPPTKDANGNVVACYNTGDVTGGSGTNIGGIIGQNYRNADGVTSCYNTGDINGGNSGVGGIIGFGETGNIDDSFSTGDITGEDDNIGGIAGRLRNQTSTSVIQNSYASGKILSNGLTPVAVAGGVGDWEGTGGMTDVWFSGKIEMLNADDSGRLENIGGLVGTWDDSGSDCLRCDSTGTMVISISGATQTHRYIGGLIGYNRSDITDSSAAVTISAEQAEMVGGLVGYEYTRTLSNSFAYGDVTGRRYVGGLVGYVRDRNSQINDCGAEGNVTAVLGGGNNVYAGGLVGASGCDIRRSYASGDVTAIDGNFVGGFEGGRQDNWERVVFRSFATGDVDAGALGQFVGGFSGRARINANDYYDNFATGNVRGGEDVGGFIGYLHRQGTNALRRSYVTGQVVKATGAAGADGTFGPVVGTFDGNTNVLDSTSIYYNSDYVPVDEGSGTAIAGANTINTNGLDSAQMQVQGNFTNFDFGTPVWEMPSGSLVLPGHTVVYPSPVPEWVE